jgi:hypothetical protein
MGYELELAALGVGLLGGLLGGFWYGRRSELPPDAVEPLPEQGDHRHTWHETPFLTDPASGRDRYACRVSSCHAVLRRRIRRG